MVTVLSLWLPILLSAVLVFVASSVIHMFLGYHADDHAPIPGEAEVGDAIRAAGVPPGAYAMPYAGSMKAMGSPEFLEKMERGPVALVTVRRPGAPNMGKTLAAWFILGLGVSILAGYMAGRGAGPGADFGEVFRFAATTAVAAYVVGSWSESIWFGRKWSTTFRNTLDGVIYAAITGAVFGWLWPGV